MKPFFASLIAIRQKDLKRLIAYSSIAHVGLIAAGIVTVFGMHHYHVSRVTLMTENDSLTEIMKQYTSMRSSSP